MKQMGQTNPAETILSFGNPNRSVSRRQIGSKRATAQIRRRILRKLPERIEMEGLFFALPEKIRRRPDCARAINLNVLEQFGHTHFEDTGKSAKRDQRNMRLSTVAPAYLIGGAETIVVHRRKERNLHTAIDKKCFVSRWR